MPISLKHLLASQQAALADIRLMRETVGPDMGVKASGGVHNAEEALAMIEAGQHASVQVRV